MAHTIRNVLFALLTFVFGAAPAPSFADYALAMHGVPALPEGFAHWPYVDLDAPQGGTLKLCLLGTFDSLNPYNLKAGSTAQGLGTMVFEPLMARSYDEPFTVYGLIASGIDTDAARSFATFHLDPKARFSDGSPITADDVLFTFNLLRTKGRPQQRAAFSQVKGSQAPDPLTVRFELAGIGDRELPLFLALMPVLSRKATDAEHFDQTTLTPPVASGPYRVAAVDPGRRLVLARNPDYWGRDLPTRRGMFNFDRVEIDYYRDANSLFEAFKAGLCDYRIETDPTRWLNGYDIAALREGRIIKQAVPSRLPKGMEGFAFNMRRPIFADIRVREALAMMFDFEWVNRNLYGGLYQRTPSFFADSPLASTGHPASSTEQAFLAPFPGAVPGDILSGTWRPTVSDASGRDRTLARRALTLLDAAGYGLRGTQMLQPDGQPFNFEIMVQDHGQERLASSFAETLARIGITVSVRLVDDVQYQRRRQSFNFDMMFGSWIATPSPGAEQRSRWSSASARQEASFNLPGVASPAIDAAITAILSAGSEQDFVDDVRVLDRLLLSGAYIIPLFHTADQWVAYAARLGRPSQVPLFGLTNMSPIEFWWRTP